MRQTGQKLRCVDGKQKSTVRPNKCNFHSYINGMKKRQTDTARLQVGQLYKKAIQANFVAPVLYFIKTRNITVINSLLRPIFT
jgi:hypothetical protein